MGALAASLGSAMALLAAFVLYSQQSLLSQMQADSRYLADTVGGFGTDERGERLNMLAAAEDWRRYVRPIVVVRQHRVDADMGVNARAWMARLQANYERRQSIFVALVVALILTAVGEIQLN